MAESEVEILRSLLGDENVCVLNDAEDEEAETTAVSNSTQRDTIIWVEIQPKSDHTASDDHRITVHVSVPADVCAELFVENVSAVEADNGAAAASSSSTNVQPATMPNFERSFSARHWQTDIDVVALPQFELYVTLPPTYPDVPAQLRLVSSYLTFEQTKMVHDKMMQLQKDALGMEVMTTWVDYLQHQALLDLNIIDQYNLCDFDMPTDNGCDNDDINASHVAVQQNVLDRFLAILKCDEQQRMHRFNHTEHECPICCLSFLGTDLCHLQMCDHYFCHQCLRNYIKESTDNSKADVLKCPFDCDTMVTPSMIRKVLSDADFQRWETITLARALDSMGDIAYCPRCQLPSAVDDVDSSLRQCAHANCDYAYCKHCMEPYHPGSRCPDMIEKLERLERTKASTQTKAAAKNAMIETNLQAERRRLLELKSLLECRKLGIQCPKCGIFVMKIDGCDKLTCRMCGQYMCWTCGRAITGYEHFSNCPGNRLPRIPIVDRGVPPDAYLVQREALRQRPELAQRMAPCPRCKQLNVKRDLDNHLVCWACSCHFCYECHQPMQKPLTKHFMMKKCRQHSDR